jgi:hypothetical protein
LFRSANIDNGGMGAVRRLQGAGVMENLISMFLKGFLVGCAASRPNVEDSAIPIFDTETIVENCTIQIWENSQTGACSIGWSRGTNEHTQ